MKDTILKFNNVSFSYQEDIPALKNISLEIKKGERIAVLGNNGAGKSTFFLTCNGIIKPNSGSISFMNSNLEYTKHRLMELRKKVGIVFQDADTQIIASTVEGEISFGPINLGLDKTQVETAVHKAMEQMNLTDYALRSPQYLSGGEKKRVSIADIIAMEPEIILFDEPTASLDPCNVKLLEETLEMLSNAGITIVVSTHDIDFAYRFANRGIVFSHGNVIADCNIVELFSQDATIEEAGIKKPIVFELAHLFNIEKEKLQNIRTVQDLKREFDFLKSQR